MMTVEQIRALQPGDLVRALISVSGGVCLEDGGEIEVELPAGAIATVNEVRQYGGQGWGVTITFDNGITNVFDEGDNDGQFALIKVEDTQARRTERLCFLLEHSPPDYPADELVRDLQAIRSKPLPEPDTRTTFRVLVRGVCSGVAVVRATNEQEALDLSKRWLTGRNIGRKEAAQYILGIHEVENEFCDVEGLE